MSDKNTAGHTSLEDAGSIFLPKRPSRPARLNMAAPGYGKGENTFPYRRGTSDYANNLGYRNKYPAGRSRDDYDHGYLDAHELTEKIKSNVKHEPRGSKEK